MKPFYYSATTNFGDHMNSWLWAELCPELLAREDDIRLVGIGSLLSRNLDLVAGPKVIFGTGSGYSSLPTPEQVAAWDVRAVRGPLTARHLGLAPEKAITDGAWLISRIPRHASLPGDRSGKVFVPHWSSAAYGVWPRLCAETGIRYVDPLDDCDTVFGAIAHAELAIVESLHGAIIADFYRTPWIPVATPSRILKYKWLDWCLSLGLEYRPYPLPPSDLIDALMQGRRPSAIVTSPEPIDVAPDTFDIRQTPPPAARPGPAYFLKMRTKGILRGIRRSGLEGLSKMRDAPGLRSWNGTHSARIRDYFSNIVEQRATLSDNAIRDEKIDRLNAAFEAMRRDYGA